MPVQKIMLLVAMNKEAQPIIKQMKMKEIEHKMDNQLPAMAYEVEMGNGKVILVVSGKCTNHGVDRIGTQGLNLVAWEALKAFNPDILINAGTAGGFKKNGSMPGDVYVSTESIKYHDRLFQPDLHFLNYGIGSYKCLSVPFIAKRLGLKEGVISTGGSLLSSLQENEQMIKNNAAVKEMEAAGIAEVAQMRGVPFIGLKIVTDLVDTDECPQNQFTNNFDKLITHLAGKVQQLCVILMGERLEKISELSASDNETIKARPSS
jgi:5'-methylthioadenosine nucleosidase